MNPSVFKIILHLSTVIGAVKDIEKLIADASKGNNIVADLQKIADDVVALFEAGLIQPPEGLTMDQIKQMLAEFKSAIG